MTRERTIPNYTMPITTIPFDKIPRSTTVYRKTLSFERSQKVFWEHAGGIKNASVLLRRDKWNLATSAVVSRNDDRTNCCAWTTKIRKTFDMMTIVTKRYMWLLLLLFPRCFIKWENKNKKSNWPNRAGNNVNVIIVPGFRVFVLYECIRAEFEMKNPRIKIHETTAYSKNRFWLWNSGRQRASRETIFMASNTKTLNLTLSI